MDNTKQLRTNSYEKDNFLVVGLVRNCESYIKKEIGRLSAVFSIFPNLHWLLIESDSTDKSVEKLNELTLEVNQFRCLSLGSLGGEFPLRTERIAYCRNRYLDELENNKEYQSITYVIVMDFDQVNSLITSDALESCWSKDDWDVCTANQRGPYYDIWALRHPDWSPNDCADYSRFLFKHMVNVEEAIHLAVYSKMITINETCDWIEVESSFGGLAIYRRQALKGVRYIGLNNIGLEMCEHVPLHQQLKVNGYKIYINPQLINAGYTEHSYRFSKKARAIVLVKSIIKNAIFWSQIKRLKNLFV